jgi:cytochrome P450
MKTLTFNVLCSLLFGVERGARRDKFVACFQEMVLGTWSVPINFPFTRYNCGLRASATVRNMVKDLIREKRVELEQKGASPHQDLVTCLLSTRKEGNEEALTENEIVHNVMFVMLAGHDTTSVLVTFIMRILANEPSVYAAVLQGMHKTLSLNAMMID